MKWFSVTRALSIGLNDSGLSNFFSLIVVSRSLKTALYGRFFICRSFAAAARFLSVIAGLLPLKNL